MKTTEWFPAHVCPVYLGVYQMGEDLFKWYAYWDGRKFGFRSKSSRGAYENRNRPTSLPDSSIWRGLAEQPE